MDQCSNMEQRAIVGASGTIGGHANSARRSHNLLKLHTQATWQAFCSRGATHHSTLGLARIALLPLGHLLGRIPLGNIGRSTVAVTKVMEPPEAVQRLIDWAVLAVRIPALTRH